MAVAADRQSDMAPLLEWAWALNELYSERARPQPNVKYLKQLTGVITWTEKHFGLTPRARARLGIAIGQQKVTAQELNRRLRGGTDANRA